MGFDGETSNSARKLADVVEQGKIVMSMQCPEHRLLADGLVRVGWARA